jgi:hypothetical protein
MATGFLLLDALKRMFSWSYSPAPKSSGTESNRVSLLSDVYPLRPATTSAPPLPEFDFKPCDDFAAALGKDAVFVVANPLDLAPSHCAKSFMSSVLVVEVSGPNTVRSIMWFRIDSADLASCGVSACRMFVDADHQFVAAGMPGFAPFEWVGVCGWVMDRKRM